MSLTVTRKERDALYERIVTRLNGIDDVYRVVEEEDWAAAQALGQEFADLLCFVCHDLGWGETAEVTVSLRTPPQVLSRAVEVVRDLARADAAHFEAEKRDAEAQENEARYLQRTCERLLAELPPRRGE